MSIPILKGVAIHTSISSVFTSTWLDILKNVKLPFELLYILKNTFMLYKYYYIFNFELAFLIIPILKNCVDACLYLFNFQDRNLVEKQA